MQCQVILGLVFIVPLAWPVLGLADDKMEAFSDRQLTFGCI